MVGGPMAIDLCRDFDVTSVDISNEPLEELKKKFPIETIRTELSDPANVREVIEGRDLVIGAVPGFMGYETFKTVIDAGKDIVDISFFPEDPFDLDALAVERGVTAVMDCGVAPGMCNALLGYHDKTMEVESYECLVGGLPVKRSWPFQYKAPFSPIDVIEEYIRPARLVKDGRLVVMPALSEPELVDFEPVGSLEAFNTDGLRTLIKTMKAPNMKEKTMRYPGSIEYIRLLRECGFFGYDPIDVEGRPVRPIDLTSRLLFAEWKLEREEPELTIMRVTIRGREGGQRKEYVYNLFDRYDEETRTSSMARTTGYTCTAAARLVLAGVYKRKGMSPPEHLGAAPGCLDRLLDYFKERNIHYIREEKTI